MYKLFINANIYTFNDNMQNADCLCIKDDKIIDVGKTKDLLKKYMNTAFITDMEDKTILPGLFDSHLHLMGVARQLIQLDLSGMDKQSALEAIKHKVSLTEKGVWIKGRGWNNELWGEDLPTAKVLDEICPDNPITLNRACGHSSWINTMAINLLGICRDTPDPVGGEIVRDEIGNATGLLAETAQDLLSCVVPIDEKLTEQNVIDAQSYLHSLGIVSVGDAGTDDEAFSLYKRLGESRDLTLKVYCMKSIDDDLDLSALQLPINNLFNNHLKMRCAKLFDDGSLGSRGAWLTHEYADRKGHYGNSRYTDDQLKELVLGLHTKGYQIAIHAIGDRGIKQSLSAYDYAQNKSYREDARHRIEHFQINTKEDIMWTKELGVLPSMQSCHLHTDWRMAESKLGDNKKSMFRFRDIIDAKLIIPNGSDCPVEPPNPFFGMHAAIARTDRQNNPDGGYEIRQGMTRLEALYSYSLWAAYGQFEEESKGSLTIGKCADFIVTDKDYFGCMIDEIKDIRVLETWVDGELVFEAPKL